MKILCVTIAGGLAAGILSPATAVGQTENQFETFDDLVLNDENHAMPLVDEVFFDKLGRVKSKKLISSMALNPVAVSSSSVSAVEYVQAGFSYLHAGWDTEAYRYFCEALRNDKECLMAHVGICMALAFPQAHELQGQRNAAVIRMVTIADRKNEKGEHLVPSIERGYAFSVAHLALNGAKAGRQAFAEFSKRFPDDLQAKMFSLLLNRDGYDENGKPNKGEKKVLDELNKLLEEQPANALIWQYYLVVHFNAPMEVGKIRSDVLPIARKLAEAWPEGGTWQHWLGIFEYRAGNLVKSEAAFKKSYILLEGWREAEKLGYEDSDALLKSMLYLAHVRKIRGDQKGADEISNKLSKMVIDDDRLNSVGAQLMLWEGYTLAARLSLTLTGGETRALKILPGKKELEKYYDKSLMPIFVEGFQRYLAAREALFEGREKQFPLLMQGLARSVNKLNDVEIAARAHSSLPEYLRYRSFIAMLYHELDGKRSVAYEFSLFSYEKAQSLQTSSTRLLPPTLSYPIEVRMIQSHLALKQYEEAKQVGETRLLSDVASVLLWKEMVKVYAALGDKEKKKSAEEMISRLNEDG